MPSRRYFGTDGIRGRVGEWPITAEFMLKLGRAAGVVSWDAEVMRRLSPCLPPLRSAMTPCHEPELAAAGNPSVKTPLPPPWRLAMIVSRAGVAQWQSCSFPSY